MCNLSPDVGKFHARANLRLLCSVEFDMRAKTDSLCSSIISVLSTGGFRIL